MVWKKESRRHSLARKGIKTANKPMDASGNIKLPNKFSISDFEYSGEGFWHEDISTKEEYEEEYGDELDVPFLTDLGFSGTGTGFLDYADIYSYKGNPVFAYNYDGSTLDGFEIHPDFRKKGIFKVFIDDQIKSNGGALRFSAPTDKVLEIFRKHYDVEYNEDEWVGILRFKKEK